LELSKKKLIRLSHDIVIREWKDKKLLLIPKKSNDKRDTIAIDNPTAVSIIKAINDNGKNDLENIIRIIKKEWKNVDNKDIKDFIVQLSELGYIQDISNSDTTLKNNTLVSDRFEYLSKSSNNPVHLSIELTRRCNFICPFCYTRLNTINYTEASLNDYYRILSEAIDLGVVEFTLSGGEILLRPELIYNLVPFLAKKGTKINLFTNASLLEKYPNIVDIIAEYAPNIEITMYAITLEKHKAITGHDINSVFRGIECLLRNNIKPALKTTVSKDNVDEIDLINQYAISNNLEYRYDFLLVRRPDKKKNGIEEQRLTPNQICEKEICDRQRSMWLKSRKKELVKDNFSNSSENLPFFHCEAGISSGFVGSDLRYSVCCLIRQQKYTYDLTCRTLHDAFNEYTKSIRNINNNKKNECNKCSIFNLCLYGGCPAQVLNQDYQDTEYFCRVAKARAKRMFEMEF